MKTVIITEQQFKRLVENIINEQEEFDVDKYLEKKWKMEDEFRDIMKDAIEKTNLNYPNKIYYVDKNNNKEIYMEYDQKTKVVWIDYIKLWSIFESKYSLNYDETSEFFKGMLREHYGLRGITPNILSPAVHYRIGKELQFEGITPLKN